MKSFFLSITIASIALLLHSCSVAQKPWKQGILVDEFIIENPPFPESHAATIEETPEGLIAAWFGEDAGGLHDVASTITTVINENTYFIA